MNCTGSIKPLKREIVKILVVFGTRPEAIKMAPLVTALSQTPEFNVKTVVTAQHREMLDQVLELFRIKPEFDLNIMAAGQSLTEITCRVLEGLEPILKAESPDLLMVHGDTTTTFASSLAAFYHHIKVAHVEAGLRTGDPWLPYPEEMNRRLTGRVADLHFAPTNQAKTNLLKENITADTIQVTGNTVIDALLYCVKQFPQPLAETGNRERQILVTAHRRENWGEPLERIAQALKDILMANPDVRMLIPMHRNPAVRKTFLALLGDQPRASLVEPLDYRAMVSAMVDSYMVITDSGGIQEEAPALGKPVLVLRDQTERPEAVTAGTVKLVGADYDQIVGTANLLLKDSSAYLKMAQATNPYGDGKAVSRIIDGLRFRFGYKTTKPAEFLQI